LDKAIDKISGVYYESGDYGSLGKRFLAIAVDSCFILILALIVAWIWSFFTKPPDMNFVISHGWLSIAILSPKYFWFCTIMAYFYLSIIKPTKARTIGYRLANLKIVDLKGNQPSISKMTWRFILLIFGPFSLLIDLFWLGGDENRQTLRDKFVGTYVIKPNATPVGSGSIIYATYYLFGYSLIFQEVKRKEICEEGSN